MSIINSIQATFDHIRSDHHQGVFFKGAVGSFVIKFIGSGLLFASQVVLARLCGADQFGIYSYALSWLMILIIPAKLGFDTSLLRFIPEYTIKKDWGRLGGILHASFLHTGLISIALAVIGNLFIGIFEKFIQAQWILPIRIMLVVLPFYTLTVIRQAALRAFKKVVLADLPESVVRPILTILLAYSVTCFFRQLDATSAWLIQLAVVAVAFVLGTFLLLQKTPVAAKTVPRMKDTKFWLRTSLPMFLMNGMDIILSQASILFLGFFRPAEDIAIFSAASRIVILATFILMAINSIAAPMISELYYAQNRDALQSILRFSAKGIAVFTCCTTLLIVVFGRSILNLFGHEFVDGYFILLILLAGQTIKTLMGPASFLLNLTGHQNLTAKVMAVTVFVALVLNIILIPKWGATGAAIASGIILVMWNVTLVIMAIRVVHFDPSVFCLLRKEKMLPA
ncbi:flippase [candidate division KSB1 bacterium]|nr:flippase [candidate division KSB1 bacterium]RQW05732.1 MAG: flippase [candidate division KSB1 bacterium]